MHNYNKHPPILEITLISAQDLNTASSIFSRRIRPFVSVTTNNYNNNNGKSKHLKTCKTRIDEKGGVNPTWGDTFQLALDDAFFYQRHPGIYLRLYTKRLLTGETQLGWCLIPVTDIVTGFSPVGSTRFLSYRLRDRDGSRVHGVVNVAVKLVNSVTANPPIFSVPRFSEMYESDRTVIGIPVNL